MILRCEVGRSSYSGPPTYDSEVLAHFLGTARCSACECSHTALRLRALWEKSNSRQEAMNHAPGLLGLTTHQGC